MTVFYFSVHFSRCVSYVKERLFGGGFFVGELRQYDGGHPKSTAECAVDTGRTA